MKRERIPKAINILAERFEHLNWGLVDTPLGQREKIYRWLGEPDEEIMVAVYKGRDIHEAFHRHDFFFFNYAYRGDYGAISYRYDNQITVRCGECYIGQPFAGYALYGQSDEDIIIIGVLIKKETFFKTFLPVLSSNSKLFRFFLEPQTNKFSDEFIHLKFDENLQIRPLLEMMAHEYANKCSDTQNILKPLALALYMYVARQYSASDRTLEDERLSDKIVRYMGEHSDTVTLKVIAKTFSYHPNYISSLLHRELGKTFSEILLEQRMSKSVALLRGTTLSIEEIAEMLGYSNTSNFYKAFREYYGKSPREFINA